MTIPRFFQDCDATMERAVKAGAVIKMPAMDMFWGDRYGVVVDPFGHAWSLATHLSDPTTEEMAKAAQAAFASA